VSACAVAVSSPGPIHITIGRRMLSTTEDLSAAG